MLVSHGETENEFETTYQFLSKIKFYKMHIFKYSPRKGTKASQMKEQIAGNIKEQRSEKLIQLSNKNQKEYHDKYLGKEVEILCEEEKNGYYQGHTKNYILAKMKEKREEELQKTKKEQQDAKQQGKNLENLENKIIKATCIETKNDHILVKQ